MPHEQAQSKALGVGLARIDPAVNVWQEPLCLSGEGLGRESVAGGPVVNMRQEALNLHKAALKVGLVIQDEGMELVFLKVVMRQLPEKRLS